MRLKTLFFSIFKVEFSGRDLILIVGGLFLFGKSTLEIHNSLEGVERKRCCQERAIWFTP